MGNAARCTYVDVLSTYCVKLVVFLLLSMGVLKIDGIGGMGGIECRPLPPPHHSTALRQSTHKNHNLATKPPIHYTPPLIE